MKARKRITTLCLIALIASALGISMVLSSCADVAPAAEGVEVGKPAPYFALNDAGGQARHLSDFRGKYIVLEWFNHGCPFVKKHYDSGNMQNLQNEYAKKGVIWLSICSSAPGKQGSCSGSEHETVFRLKKSAPQCILVDPTGQVGRLYGAKTTPQMFVIDPKGILIYEGAIDDKPDTDPASVATAHNYVKEALDKSMAGKPITTPTTKSYGCSVKY